MLCRKPIILSGRAIPLKPLRLPMGSVHRGKLTATQSGAAADAGSAKPGDELSGPMLEPSAANNNWVSQCAWGHMRYRYGYEPHMPCTAH